MLSAEASSRVASAFAQAGDALEVGSATDIEGELGALLAEPVRWFLGHPNWPTGLIGHRSPFELSVALPEREPASLRFYLDATDHRLGLAGNWTHYLEVSHAVSGAPAELLWSLHARHLDGMGPLFRSRMLHGMDYLAGGERSSTLYFQSRWLPFPQMKRRIPEPAATVERHAARYGIPEPAELEFVAYQFETAEPECPQVKLYQRPRFDAGRRRLVDVTGDHPDLHWARELTERMRPKGPGWLPAQSITVQFVPAPGGVCAMRVQVAAAPWGWGETEGFARLLTYIDTRWGVDLEPLTRVLGTFAEAGVRVRPSFVGIGAGVERPATAFYFYPLFDEVAAGRRVMRPVSGFDRITATRRAGERYLLEHRRDDGAWSDLHVDEADGFWVDYPLEGAADEWSTGYVGAILAQDAHLRPELEPTARWLVERCRPGEGWGWNGQVAPDVESTALALLFLAETGVAPPGDDGAAMLARYRMPSGGYRAYRDWDIDDERGWGPSDVTAVALYAGLRLGVDDDWLRTVRLLLAQQRDDGGWNAGWWTEPLVGTHRVIAALAAFADVSRSGEGLEEARRGLRQANPSTQARPIGPEAFSLGTWLSTWFGSGGAASHPTVQRIVDRLVTGQQDDGRWLGSPVRRIAHGPARSPWARADAGKMLVDRASLITTAAVVGGLRAVEAALHGRGEEAPAAAVASSGA